MPSQAHETMVQMLINRPPAAPDATIDDARAGFEQMTALFPVAADVVTEAAVVGGVPGEWVSVPESREDRVVLYLHGGGYVIGSLNTHRELGSRIARAAGARTFNVDYRLAPEHPFPAAIEDATAAYRGLLEQGVEPGRILIAGDSAGGGLTLATLLSLRDAGTPLPAAAVCLSPWADLEMTGASAQPGGADDPLLTVAGLAEMAGHYAKGRTADPLASPVHADLSGLPPLLIQVGTREVLLDDATRIADAAERAGVPVELEPWEGLIHVWHIFGPNIPEAVDAVARIGEFARKHL